MRNNSKKLRRVSEVVQDVDYWGKLSKKEKEWYLEFIQSEVKGIFKGKSLVKTSSKPNRDFYSEEERKKIQKKIYQYDCDLLNKWSRVDLDDDAMDEAEESFSSEFSEGITEDDMIDRIDSDMEQTRSLVDAYINAKEIIEDGE